MRTCVKMSTGARPAPLIMINNIHPASSITFIDNKTLYLKNNCNDNHEPFLIVFHKDIIFKASLFELENKIFILHYKTSNEIHTSVELHSS